MTNSIAACGFAAMLTILTVSSACGGLDQATAPQQVRVATTGTSFVAGDAITLTIQNLGGVLLSYNACFDTRLQRRVGSSWITVPKADGPPCTANLSPLPVGAIDSLTLVLPTDLATGAYRVFIGSVASGGAGPNTEIRERSSNTFQVRAR